MAPSYILSQIAWFLMQPGNLLFSLIVVGVFLKWRGYDRWAGRILFPTLTVFFLLAFTPVGNFLIVPLEKRFADFRHIEDTEEFSGIIVLGGAERASKTYTHRQPHFSGAAERAIQGAWLARRYPELPLIYTGGLGPEGEFNEADVARIFFEQAGIDMNRVRLENRSYNTYTNAFYVKDIIQNNEKTKPWLLVTTAMHMPRSVAAFRKVGINIRPYPVDYRSNLKYLGWSKPYLSYNMVDVDYAVHEWIGLVVYYVTGRASSLYPAPKEAG